jgi:outer membrane protein TolC
MDVGKAGLQDVLRAQIEEERMRVELLNLEDYGGCCAAEWRAALGVDSSQPLPPIPAVFEETRVAVEPDRLLSEALARNPRLKGMETDIHRAEAAIRLARKSRTPDFALGLEADAKMSPVLYRPEAGMTLPIWRDKFQAQVAGAQAEWHAATARLAAERLSVAADLAEKNWMYQEANRNYNLLQESLLPKARQSLEAVRGSYFTGRTDFLNLIDAWRTLLDFELASVNAQNKRELALNELLLLIAAHGREDAPLLPPGR